MDIYPMVLELTRTKIPGGLDGESFLPALKKKSATQRTGPSCFWPTARCSVRFGMQRCKLIVYPKINRSQLFDLQQDADELNNVSGLLEHRTRVQKMMADLSKLQQKFGDSLPLQSATPTPSEFVPPSGEALREVRKRWNMGS